MRYAVVSVVALVLAACTTTPPTRSQVPASGAPKGPGEEPARFLLAAAASDFHLHGPQVARFRHVRIGHVLGADQAKQYRLCGEFLPAGQGKADWTPFATIKTSGYEQWVGALAAGPCQSAGITWEDEVDFSSSLQRELESMR